MVVYLCDMPLTCDATRRQTNKIFRDKPQWWLGMLAVCSACIVVLVPYPTVSAATGWYFTFNIIRRLTDRRILHTQDSGMASTDWESHLCGALLGLVFAGVLAQYQHLVDRIDVTNDLEQMLAISAVFGSALYDR